MEMADAMVAKGLDKLGYIYVAIDCGWNLHTRDASGNLQPDPKKFPRGIAAVAKYVKGLGDGLLKLGIYSEHDLGDCCGGPGMKGHEDQDAAFYQANGIEYLKATRILITSCSISSPHPHPHVNPRPNTCPGRLLRGSQAKPTPDVRQLCQHPRCTEPHG